MRSGSGYGYGDEASSGRRLSLFPPVGRPVDELCSPRSDSDTGFVTLTVAWT
jgi:hypothetical protein